MTDTTTSRAGASWAPFLIGCVAFFTIMSGATVPTPLYPIYSDRYGFSPLIITAIFAIYSAGVITTLLLTGPWSDQIGRKPLLFGGLALAAADAVAFVFTDGLLLLLVARLLQGASVGIFTSAATVAVTEMAPDGHKRIGGVGATAANMGGLGAGSIIGGVVATVFAAPLVAPYLVHLAMVAVSIGLLLTVPEPTRRADDPSLRPQGLDVPAEVRGLFVPAAISAFAGFMVCGFLGAVSPSYFGQILGFQGDHIVIGTAAGLIFLFSCLGQIICESLPPRAVLPGGMGVLTAGLAGITWGLAAAALWPLLIAIAVAGLGHGIAFKGGLTSLSRNSPDDHTAAVTATYFTVAYVAISIPVLIVGVLQGPVGLLPTAAGYGAAATALALASVVLILRRQSGTD